MIVLDTSEYMRNGDYIPTRYDAEVETANIVFSKKTRDNPESTVGLMTLDGEVKTSLVNDLGKFMTGIRETKISGPARLSAAIQVAALALKHRQNKNQRQRIIVFSGSPITEDEKDLVKLAKKVKKNNIAVDVILFGQEPDDNAGKLQAFIDTVNSGDNSRLLSVPPGPHLLSDAVSRSPILDGSNGAGGGLDFSNMFMDPTDDPELALALRMSLEEERQRQERQRQQEQGN